MRAEAGWVSKGFFRVFPVQPVLGRLPVPDEFRKGANPVAVVSHAFWRDQLGAPASLEGVRLRMSLDHEVVGVLPPGFDFPNGTQIWRPIELDDQSMSRTSHNWDVVGRLAPGVSLQAAIQDVDAIFARLEPVYAPDFDATGVIMTPLQESLNGSARDPLYLLLGASAVLLLVACSNLAGAMLARGTARAGEIAVRSALGATRLRLVRQLVTESGLLAICGGIGGILLAAALLRTFGALAPGNVRLSDITIDGWVITFAIVASVFTAVTFGLAPAVRLSDSATSGMLREGGRGTSDAGRLRIWNVLVSAEVALAVALLAGSTLLIRSFARVMDARLGFDPGNVLVAEVNLPALNYAGDSPTVAAFHQRVLDRLSANTGIVAAGFSNVPPLGGNNMSGAIEVEGKPLDPRGDYNGYSLYRVVGGEFFAANGIPLLRGRSFTSADDRGAPGVVVVNETFANTEWPGQDPIGKRVRPAGMDRATADYVEPWSTVIGVVGDSRSGSPTDRFRQAFYFDQRQRPPYRARNVTYSVRSTMPPTAVAEIVRQAVHDADPDVPVEIRAMREVISSAVADRRFTMIVLGTFASIAVFLAAIGIFAVVSYSVAQRTREIGVRLALGATPAGVRRLIVGDAMRAVAPGLVIGGMLAAASAGALRSMLYDVSPFDPAALAAAMFVLASAGVASSLIPAIRSTAIDPMVAIRGE
jgi:predicted permease